MAFYWKLNEFSICRQGDSLFEEAGKDTLLKSEFASWGCGEEFARPVEALG